MSFRPAATSSRRHRCLTTLRFIYFVHISFANSWHLSKITTALIINATPWPLCQASVYCFSRQVVNLISTKSGFHRRQFGDLTALAKPDTFDFLKLILLQFSTRETLSRAVRTIQYTNTRTCQMVRLCVILRLFRAS